MLKMLKLTIEYPKEEWSIAQGILDKIIANAEIAENEDMPMCQDTGMACVFVEIRARCSYSRRKSRRCHK